jgi:hypothetical protein
VGRRRHLETIHHAKLSKFRVMDITDDSADRCSSIWYCERPYDGWYGPASSGPPAWRKEARLRPGGPGFDCLQEQETSFSPEVQAALGPNQHPIQWVPGAFSPGVKRPEGGSDHSPPPNTDINK